MVWRPMGGGPRPLPARLLLDAGVDPDAVSGPTAELHLDVALAVATGEADAGLGSAATALGLDFVPLSWEPFQVATTREQSGGVQPLLDALAEPTVGERIGALGGYDVAGAGEVIDVAGARRAPAVAGPRVRRAGVVAQERIPGTTRSAGDARRGGTSRVGILGIDVRART